MMMMVVVAVIIIIIIGRGGGRGGADRGRGGRGGQEGGQGKSWRGRSRTPSIGEKRAEESRQSRAYRDLDELSRESGFQVRKILVLSWARKSAVGVEESVTARTSNLQARAHLVPQ